MSAMGELNFFIGLQVLQKKDGIFLSQDKHVGDIIKNLDIQMSDRLILPWTRRILGEKTELIEADDQAIQTILLSIPEDIYAAVDSCETALEI
nr:putative ribonuclease H-like domain-containing protein [Tanacetum cinerariifolium]